MSRKDFFDDPTLPLQVYVRYPQPEFPMDFRDFDERVIILKGTALHVGDEQEFPVKADCTFVITQDHEHQDMQKPARANILFDPVR